MLDRCNRCGDKYCEGLKICPECGEDISCDSYKCYHCYNSYDEDDAFDSINPHC